MVNKTLLLRHCIDEFVEKLEAEFGPVPQGEYNCLLSAIEDLGVQVGDQVAKTVTEKLAAKQIVQQEPPGQCCCPVCDSPGQLKGQRNRLLDGRRGKLRISEPEYFCTKCRKSFFPSDSTDRS